MRRLFVFLLLASSLVSCAGFLPSYVMTYEYADVTGLRVAITERCTASGLLPVAMAHRMFAATQQAFSVGKVNEDGYEAGYSEGYSTPKQEVDSYCQQLNQEIPRFVTELHEFDRDARQSLARSNAQWGQMVTPIQIPDFSAAVARQPQANTTQQATSPVSILINTPSGVQQCIVNSNGYAFCP